MKILILYLFLSFVGFNSASFDDSILKFSEFMVQCKSSRNLNLDVSSITVYVHDFQNGVYYMVPIYEATQAILYLSNLHKENKIFMFVDGFKSHINTDTAKQVRSAFSHIPNSYLIIIDHSAYTNNIGLTESYEDAIKYVYSIGKKLAQMLVDLHKAGISAKNIHCIGNSLGSQMLAHVGENFFKATSEKISRITALDPAGPCFSSSPIQNQIRSGVAEYVEVYHCNAGGFGTTRLLGDVDFFVNDGVSQPNCRNAWILGFFDPLLAAKCSHRTCVSMWTASVAYRYGYTAYKCGNYENFKADTCFLNDWTIAGFWNPGYATGVYYFSTENYDFS